MLAFCVAIALLPAPAAADREPIDARAREAWHQLGENIEAGAAYATAVAYSQGAMACPLPEATFVDSWGAPRTGHSHLGVDMMAPDGATVLAPASGIYRQHGTESFYLEAVNGILYFGTHLSGHLHVDGPVVAGEPVAVNSNTGNASGGAAHLHLQIAPDGSTWENPYPATAAACSNASPGPGTYISTPRMQVDAPTFVYGVMEIHRWWNATHGRIDGRTARTLTRFLNTVVGNRLAAFIDAITIPYEANWDRVAACESGGNWSINTGNGFYGGLQFDYGTWLGAGGGQYAERADLASKAEQIRIAERVRADRGLSPWPHCGPRWY